jgi:hypothetical protein
MVVDENHHLSVMNDFGSNLSVASHLLLVVYNHSMNNHPMNNHPVNNHGYDVC